MTSLSDFCTSNNSTYIRILPTFRAFLIYLDNRSLHNNYVEKHAFTSRENVGSISSDLEYTCLHKHTPVSSVLLTIIFFILLMCMSCPSLLLPQNYFRCIYMYNTELLLVWSFIYFLHQTLSYVMANHSFTPLFLNSTSVGCA